MMMIWLCLKKEGLSPRGEFSKEENADYPVHLHYICRGTAQMYEPSKQLGHLLSVLSQNISLGGYRSTHVM